MAVAVVAAFVAPGLSSAVALAVGGAGAAAVVVASGGGTAAVATFVGRHEENIRQGLYVVVCGLLFAATVVLLIGAVGAVGPTGAGAARVDAAAEEPTVSDVITAPTQWPRPVVEAYTTTDAEAANATACAMIGGVGEPGGESVVDTGAEIFCFPSSEGCTVLEANPPLDVRVANKQVVRPESRVVTDLALTCAATGNVHIVESVQGYVSPHFGKLLVSTPILSAHHGLEVHTYRSPKLGGQLEWLDGSTCGFTGPPYRVTVALSVPATVETFSASTDVWTWHRRLGHPSEGTMSWLWNTTEGTPFTGPVRLPCPCEQCLVSKAIRRHLAAHGITTTRCGQLTHLDASGPYVSDIFWGALYRLGFVDDFSRVRYIVPVLDRTWASAQAAFLEYAAFIHFWSGNIPAGFTWDNAPEYVGEESREFTDEAAMQRLASCDYEPRSNGTAESTWRHTDPGVRALLVTAISDPRKRMRYFMLASVHQCNYVNNRMPSSSLPSHVAPMTVLSGKVQTLKHAKIWGSQMTVTSPVQRRGVKREHHMDSTGRLAMNVGIAQHHKGYIAQYLDDGSFEPVINVTHQESTFPMLAPTPEPPPLPPLQPLPMQHVLEKIKLAPPPGITLPPFPPPAMPGGISPAPADDDLGAEVGSDGGDDGTFTPPPVQPRLMPTPPTPQRTGARQPMPEQPHVPSELRSRRGDGAPWRLPGSQREEMAPRRPGSRTRADQRVSANVASVLLAAAASYDGSTMPAFPRERSGEVDLDDAESYASVVDVDGVRVTYESCVAPFPSVFAAASREAKVRFFETAQGVRRIEVPRHYREAMQHQRAPTLWDAMCREMSAQRERSTYTLVPRSAFPDEDVLPLGWVYDLKVSETSPDGILDKARLIGRGNYSVWGKHFFEAFAGVARLSSFRTTLAYAAQRALFLTTGDVPTAYLNATIYDAIVLSEQPPGFEEVGPNGEPAHDMVCRWTRALYGFVSSAREWAIEFIDWLVGYGCAVCPSDSKVLVLVREVNGTQMLLIICLHVDDLLMAHSHEAIRTAFMSDCPYKIKDLGRARRIVGGDIDQDLIAGTVKLSLRTYLATVAHRFALTEVRHAVTPTTQKLVAECKRVDDTPGLPSRAEIDEVSEFFMQGSGVALFVASFARPEAAHHARYCTTRFLSCGFAHRAFLIHLLSYYVNTKELGLNYLQGESFNATGVYCPADDPRDARLHGIGDASYVLPRGVGGSCVMMCGAAVAWRVGVHRAPSISPGEDEFYALTNTITETVTIRQLIEEFGHVFPSATFVFSDASTARALAQDANTTARTRFIHRRWFFANFYTDEGVVQIMPIRGGRNPANVLTKFTFGVLFFRERDYLLGLVV